jgi:hypothetical protein
MDERSSSVDIDGILFIIIIILGKNRNNRRLRERFSFCFLFSSGPFVNWPLSLSLSHGICGTFYCLPFVATLL